MCHKTFCISSFNSENIKSVEDLFLKIISLPHSNNFEIKAIRNEKSHDFQGKLGKTDGIDIFVYNESATRVAVKFKQPAIFNGDIKGNGLTINGKGVWLEFQRKTGGFTQAFPSQAKFSVALLGRVTSDGEAIHFQYKFEYPDLGDHSRGKFTAIRIAD